MRTAALAAAVLLAGCGTSHALPARRAPVGPREWRAVLEDWYAHGEVTDGHACAAIVIATEHLPSSPPAYSTVREDLDRAAAWQCAARGRLDDLRPGMSDADVAAIAGRPRTAYPGCWLYPVTRDHDGRRVCFTRGRVTTLQRSVHG